MQRLKWKDKDNSISSWFFVSNTRECAKKTKEKTGARWENRKKIKMEKMARLSVAASTVGTLKCMYFSKVKDTLHFSMYLHYKNVKTTRKTITRIKRCDESAFYLNFWTNTETPKNTHTHTQALERKNLIILARIKQEICSTTTMRVDLHLRKMWNLHYSMVQMQMPYFAFAWAKN